MPFACATAVSIGVVMKPAMESGSAPGKTVVMVTRPFSVLGYARTCSELKERSPTIKIIRLTTEASTGRRMKMSVNFMRRCALLVRRRRVRVVRRQQLVVDDHRRAVAQLHLAGRDDHVALVDAAQDRHLIAARRAELDEALQNGIAVAVRAARYRRCRRRGCR